MTRNSRKILLATTMLAGLAISTHDAAQAGPNGPSFSGGSISGFSSTRMDFNRVGGPGRALSRSELRVVPLEVVKKIDIPKDEKPKGTKSVAKKDPATKGTNVARVSSPKSVSGGKGKNDVGNGPKLQINPAIVEAYAVTGGNIGDVSRFDEFAERLGKGPLVVAVPFLPGNDGSFNWPVDKPDTEQSRFDPNSLLNWYASAPGGPNTGKTGWAAGDPWRVVGEPWTINGTTYTLYYNKERDTFQSEATNDSTGDATNTEYGPGERPGIDEGDTVRTTNMSGDPVVITAGEDDAGYAGEKEDPEKAEPNEKDSQPSEGQSARGLGRPDTICGPGGCWTSGATSVRQVLPRDPDGSTATTTRRQSPGWATDPNPDGLGGTAAGSGYSGYTPQGEEGGDIGGPGNPALAGLDAAQ